jgi:hypothetical protein
MKNIKYLIAFLLFGLSFQLFSQLSIGVVKTDMSKPGWSMVMMQMFQEDAKIHVDRFQISGLSYLELSKHFKIGAEPGFVQRGAACFPGFVNFIGDTKLFSNYIEFTYNGFQFQFRCSEINLKCLEKQVMVLLICYQLLGR